MGSGSKKHKEKHRKKEKHRHRSKSKERRKKSRSRSRSRSPLNNQGTNDKRDWKDYDDQNRDRDYQDEVQRELERIRYEQDREKKREKAREASSRSSTQSHTQRDRPKTAASTSTDSAADAPQAQEGSGDISLSIAETNKLRAKLGLKPLDVGGVKAESKEVSYENREDVHAPAVNIADQRRAEKLREKLAEIREKKRTREKLGKVKKLADTDDPVVESAAEWVARIKQKQKEKEEAERRAKMLTEMDEEFGVSGLAEEMFGRNIPQRNSKQNYTSRDLRGIKIEHGEEDFQEGRATILTLQDRGILDEEDEDVLENVNMVDNRKAMKNIENRKKRPDYRPYDEVDDETGMFRPRGILEKYDEEIEGVNKKSFRLDATGQADMEDEYEMQRIRDNLRAQQFSLEMAAPQLATDYYTQEEMVKFKKPRKKRKVRKKQMLKADDLLPLTQPTEDNQPKKKKLKGILKNSANKNKDDDMDIDEEEFRQPYIEEENPLEDDEAELELQLALQRSRKAKLKTIGDNNRVGPEKVAEKVLSSPIEPMEDAAVKPQQKKTLKGSIILDSTSEFCRTLGEIPTVGPLQNANESDNEDESMVLGEGWEQVVDAKGEAKTESKEEESVLDEEPTVLGGVASAIQLANMKGYLEGEKKKEYKFAALNLPETKAVLDEEKLRDEERIRIQRGYDRDRDRERYDPFAFKEKEGYKPNIKLEYVDDSGRTLNQKEHIGSTGHMYSWCQQR